MRLPGKHLIASDADTIVRRASPAIKVLLAALVGLWLFTLAVNGQLDWVGNALKVARAGIKWAAGVALLLAMIASLVQAVRFWAARNQQLVSDLASDLRLIGTVLKPILDCQFGLKHAFAIITLLAILLGVVYTPGLHPFLIFFGSLYACGPWAGLLAHKLVGARWPGYERLAVYVLLVTLLATALWFAFSSVFLQRSMQLTMWQLLYITLILWSPQIALYVVLREVLTDATPLALTRRQLVSRGACVAGCLVAIALGIKFAADDTNQRLSLQAVRLGAQVKSNESGRLTVRVSGFGIDDGKMREIVRVRGVTSVMIDQANLSSQGYGQLRRLPELRRVSIRDTGFTGAELRGLQGIKQLEELELHDTLLSVKDLALLAEFRNLKRLTLVAPRMGDLEFKQTCRNVKLEHLDIDLPNLSDKGFVACRQLSQLKSLRIRSAFLVTDKGLAVLRELPELTACEVHNTGASWPAIEAQMTRCAEHRRSRISR